MEVRDLRIGILNNSFTTYYLYLNHKMNEKTSLNEMSSWLWNNAVEWKIDSGMVVADFFKGQYYEAIMDH